MDKSNRPRSREEHVTDESKGVHRRGEGLHTGGPVGDAGGYHERSQGHSTGGISEDRGILDEALGGLTGGGGNNAEQMIESMVINTVAKELTSGKKGSKKMLVLILIIVVLFLVFGGGGALLSGMLGGGSGISSSHSLYGGNRSSWSGDRNTGELNTKVASGARDKRTVIKGDGKDTVTIMVYMCGTDLESKGGMATADLQEMAAATISSKINLLVYTGGCTGWRNNVISSDTNQIYQVKDGKLSRLVEDAGDKPMTDPATLTEYIKWCKKNFPADRNELILWDHGGGSTSGYGYDQKYPNSGSMTLSGIDEALSDAGMTFDFIGFDACLMATMENALMLSQYSDYLIASEETEPGVGWYYTDWLTTFSKNTSVPTLEIGKQIADDFVAMCNQKCAGQQTTLSVIDLAELEKTGPAALTAFSKSMGSLIEKKDYQTVSNARSDTREFAASVGIDQVDLIHLAENLGSEDGKELSSVLRSAVKYNLTSNNMTNAYGVSIYFPYEKVSSVDGMVKTYKEIGMDKEYTDCIQKFASLEVGGQVAAGGSASSLGSLLGSLGGSSSGSSSVGADMVGQLLGSFLGGEFGSVSGLDSSNTGFVSGKMLEDSEGYLTDNRFDESNLIWEENDEGQAVMRLSENQWDLIQSVEMNMFYDDGTGYVDLGLDNLYEFDVDGNLVGENDHTWVAINGQPVAYYYLDETGDGDNYTITGRVPAMLNGDRVDLILIFDNENPYGYIAGARTDYDETETETVARGLMELKEGDQLDFLCDYYTYDGEFEDSYYLGETMTVGADMEISNVDVGEGAVQCTYRLTDIYNQHHWTPVVE